MEKRLTMAATIETTRKTGLLNLPTELLCLIVELVEKDLYSITNPYRDIQDLRLTCRQLRDAAYKSFAIRFFRKRSHIISAFSINTLHDIISDPHFGPHVKELTLVVRRSRYTGYDRAFVLRKRGEENDMHASDKNFVDSGLYGQLMENVFAVAHSHGNNLIIMVKKLSGTAQGWFDHGSETRYSESYALARTLEAARRAGVPPPEFHVETGLGSNNMKNTIMNHLSSQEDHCFSFSFYSENTKIMYYHRRNTLKLANYAVFVHNRFDERITQVVHALPAQMAITRVEVNGFWLEDGDQFATHVLRPLLPLLESVELCSM
ncbi:hypothetical protein D6D13_03722 [Aureobasidium pullulans]|uniref:F-box domain-containing protein n=1 Tax=Aureobasidium pullulans TaxID=5580 RepID=A0A4S9D096_AURPU|nr:hypothetical protein D6D13_03722 [Aureobasidium pullulans]